jgi:ATP-binding cassette subfamily B protein
MKQDIAFFDETKTGELISRLSSDSTLMQQATTTAIPDLVVGIIKVVVALALMFWISPPLAGVTIGFVLIVLAMAFPFGTAIGRLTKKYQNVLGQAQSHSAEAFSAMRTVQSFGAEEKELQRYRDKIGDPHADSLLFPLWYPKNAKDHVTTYSVGYFRAIYNSAFFVTVFGFGFGFLYCSLWYGLKLVTDGKLSLGHLTAFQSYIFTIGGSLGQTATVATQVLEAQGASARIFQLLERIPKIPQRRPPADGSKESVATHTDQESSVNGTTDPSVELGTDDQIENDDDKSAPIDAPPFFESIVIPSSVTGDVEFHDVSFSYSSRLDTAVLKNFSLKIRAGESAALVGSSGAGKSTVVALMQRFYDVTKGSITLDGNDIRSLDLKWYRRQIGFVQQEPQLFGLTIRQNVCYGILENEQSITDEEVYEACRKANAHDFIQEWPNGYDTLVGERGVKLSGGQKQRIAIARALLINPRILLLDEATSALDAESEHLVQEAIDKAVQGRTVLIVAHRLSTIQRAHQIVVMDNHQIVDVGTHSELMQRCTKYQDLIRRQQDISQH